MDEQITNSSFEFHNDAYEIIYVVWHRGSRIQFNESGDSLFVGSRYNDVLTFATKSKAAAEAYVKDKKSYFYTQIYLYSDL